jgi:hypothetical protein
MTFLLKHPAFPIVGDLTFWQRRPKRHEKDTPQVVARRKEVLGRGTRIPQRYKS